MNNRINGKKNDAFYIRALIMKKCKTNEDWDRIKEYCIRTNNLEAFKEYKEDDYARYHRKTGGYKRNTFWDNYGISCFEEVVHERECTQEDIW